MYPSRSWCAGFKKMDQCIGAMLSRGGGQRENRRCCSYRRADRDQCLAAVSLTAHSRAVQNPDLDGGVLMLCWRRAWCQRTDAKGQRCERHVP